MRQRERVDLSLLKRAHPLPPVVVSYGIDLHGTGSVLMGRCPFHDDRRPSLLVDPRDDHFFCFGCHAHGDVLDFVQRMEQTTFRQAIERLDITRPVADPGVLHEARRQAPPRRSTVASWGQPERACLTVAATLYHQQFLHEPHAQAYTVSRGVTPHTARRHRLGYATGGTLLPELARHGVSPHLARRVGLVHRDGQEHLAGRLVVPDLHDQQPIWLIGRALAGDADRKYLGLPGPKPLMGWETPPRGATVFVTEGPFDWLALRQWGFPAVALVGTHARSDLVGQLLTCPRVALVLDSDEAGQRASDALEQRLAPRAIHVLLPQGVKDVAELATRPDGRALFVSAVRRALAPSAA